MRKILLPALLAILLSGSLSATSMYILYEEACMDRLEYIYQNKDSKTPYVVYHVRGNTPGETIVLEVGTESGTPQNFMPAQFIRCNNAVFDTRLVNSINSNIDQVFLVTRKGNDRYFISPISFAARYVQAGDQLLYDSPKYRFQFDKKMGTIGENIAYNNPKATVTFEGKLDNDCSGAYIFRQYSEMAGNPHTDVILVPEVGVVEERSGINTADAINNTLKLDKVNNRSLERHLRRLCKGIDDVAEAEPEQRPEEFGTLPVQPKRPNLTTPVPGTTVKSPSPSAVKTHTVKKGETLYRIAKNNGLTVDQLKAMNGKGSSNMIKVGEVLKVSEGTTTAKSPAVGTVSSSGQGYRVLGQQPSGPGATVETTSSERHIVRPGETVASIALKYGYTEARFREMNDLGTYDFIKVGQPLKVDDCNCPQAEAPVVGPPVQPSTGFSARSPERVAMQQPRTPYPGTDQTVASSDYRRETFNEDGFGEGTKVQEYSNTPYFLNRPAERPRENTYTPRYEPAFGRERVQPQRPATQPAQTQPSDEFYTVGRGKTTSSKTSSAPADVPSEFYTVQPKSGAAAPRRTTIGQQPTTQARAVEEYGYRVPDQAMPGYVPRAQPQQYYQTPSPRLGERTVYIVKDGDTLYSIARTYGLNVEQLSRLNNLERGEVIIPYQKLFLN